MTPCLEPRQRDVDAVEPLLLHRRRVEPEHQHDLPHNTLHIAYCNLRCVALHCVALHCVASHCIALRRVALPCVLHCIASRCIALHSALHDSTFQCIALHRFSSGSEARSIPDEEEEEEEDASHYRHLSSSLRVDRVLEVWCTASASSASASAASIPLASSPLTLTPSASTMRVRRAGRRHHRDSTAVVTRSDERE